MQPRDLDLIRVPSDPSVHPSGSVCALAVTRPDFRADAYVGQIWEVPLDGGLPRLLTRGFRDTAPQYSPDGTRLAFLRAEAEGRPQLCVVEARGGEPRVLTDAPLGVEEFAFSPDGGRLAFVARVPEAGRYGTVEGVGARAEDPRSVRHLNYRLNGVGYTHDQRAQLFVLEVPALDEEPFVEARGRAKAGEAEAEGGSDAKASGVGSAAPGKGLPEARQLTEDAVDHAHPAFSADGAWVYSVSVHDPDAIDTLGALAVRTPVAGGPSESIGPLPAEAARVQAVREAADGAGLFLVASSLGASGTDFVGRSSHLFWHTPDDGTTVRLTADGDDLGEAPDVLRVDADGRALVLARRRGTVSVLALAPAGPDMTAAGEGGVREILAGGDVVVTGVDCAAGTVVVTVADPHGPGELAVIRDGELELLTDVNAPLRAAAPPLLPRELVAEGADWAPVHGWAVLPDGDGPHPVLLMVHGGPFAQYTGAWFDEAQVLARAGYAVLMCNPRGSAGYGEAHARAIRGRMGTDDAADVLAFLDGALAAFPGLDQDRLGILGGSYGGYLTAWVIAHEHRFRAAVVERGFLDPASFVGSADIGWFFPGEYTGWDPDAMAAQSPMARVGDVRTPTLVVHSEEDWRCPVEQAQRYYAALRLAGTEAELLLFPGENHELSRSGTPHHRLARFEHLLRWFARHLPTPGA